ncbi:MULTISPECIES: DUF6894 family protein [Bradyrhizobium]|uniref:DUF6894 family protein n=1 Tax=Bradyrhizobium elkanii TaxID=29448 RepID=UPI002714700E|nr:hypothetical protein [Bradyrhizobium elkanii]WLA51418.1 hypothetical protein QIH80_15400 [Bradyrhizobium elkanii]WLB78309.1 hypothetical protein QIH83_28665 [Bradyrhizobium elkanii]
MRRYYFDLRDGEALIPDEEGMVLPDMGSVQEEAVKALADMVHNAAQKSASLIQMAIEVRDDDGPVMQVKFAFDIVRPH